MVFNSGAGNWNEIFKTKHNLETGKVIPTKKELVVVCLFVFK